MHHHLVDSVMLFAAASQDAPSPLRPVIVIERGERRRQCCIRQQGCVSWPKNCALRQVNIMTKNKESVKFFDKLHRGLKNFLYFFMIKLIGYD